MHLLLHREQNIEAELYSKAKQVMVDCSVSSSAVTKIKRIKLLPKNKSDSKLYMVLQIKTISCA